ncbi:MULTISPECIES: hypothetical protein [unclassified Acinetobacter]|jgi:hypothetical protein|uniref:hypothetical protein n=1 Tax=Acinetobacter TaxID=469 RepID=UPI0018A9F65D|nr:MULTISPECIES: hypothetical protein [unclassified Acinetobacter]MBJ9954223.1 hypothetical protein [Acinetobacter baumannii]
MQKIKDYFQKLCYSFPVEKILNSFVVVIITLMIVLATLALLRPISPEQYQYVIQYSQQAAYPQTQNIANQLRHQDQICVADYLRLLRAYHFENQRVREYPAVDITDPE